MTLVNILEKHVQIKILTAQLVSKCWIGLELPFVQFPMLSGSFWATRLKYAKNDYGSGIHIRFRWPRTKILNVSSNSECRLWWGSIVRLHFVGSQMNSEYIVKNLEVWKSAIAANTWCRRYSKPRPAIAMLQ